MKLKLRGYIRGNKFVSWSVKKQEWFPILSSKDYWYHNEEEESYLCIRP